jgi:nucleotide-binding universal stress UspA family protein
MDSLQHMPTHFNRILFCTDLSDNADFAFSFALDAAMRRPGCELSLLHVIPESEAQFWKTYMYEVEDVDNKAKHDLDERVREAYVSKLPDGVNMQVEYRIGKDTQEILDFAKEKNIDLIILGRAGHGALQKPFFGNVTEKIVRKANCPVMVIPMTYKERLNKES